MRGSPLRGGRTSSAAAEPSRADACHERDEDAADHRLLGEDSDIPQPRQRVDVGRLDELGTESIHPAPPTPASAAWSPTKTHARGAVAVGGHYREQEIHEAGSELGRSRAIGNLRQRDADELVRNRLLLFVVVDATDHRPVCAHMVGLKAGRERHQRGCETPTKNMRRARYPRLLMARP